jgi:hypothetical protein
MASFTLDGETHECLRPDPGHAPEDTHSRTYGKYPKVLATLILGRRSEVDVYAHAEHWNPSHVCSCPGRTTTGGRRAWIQAGNVRPVTASEWDLEEYRRRPEKRRGSQWGSRLPGFLPV